MGKEKSTGMSGAAGSEGANEFVIPTWHSGTSTMRPNVQCVYGSS